MDNNYPAWVAHEYRQWIKALQDSSVHNFKESPIVQRMLGDFQGSVYEEIVHAHPIVEAIDNIGFSGYRKITGAGLRMLYYARQVLERDYSSIVEIGGGVGEFYAILRAIGYRGDYMILDLQEVQEFQKRYLAEVEKKLNIRLPLFPRVNYDACVSFFALGEFDDDTKRYYIENVINQCEHGFILWNPHSGASQEINFPCRISPQYPLEQSDCKQLEW